MSVRQIVTEIKLDWSEMDLFGHINNVAYFKYIQSARVNFLEQVGINTANPDNKLSFAVAQSTCDFKKPLYFPDVIKVISSATWIKNTSMQIEHQILNGADEVCANGKDVIVLFDYGSMQKAVISNEVRALCGL